MRRHFWSVAPFSGGNEFLTHLKYGLNLPEMQA